jgi:hypothetical protein
MDSLPREDDGVQLILSTIITDSIDNSLMQKILITMWYLWKARNDKKNLQIRIALHGSYTMQLLLISRQSTHTEVYRTNSPNKLAADPTGNKLMAIQPPWRPLHYCNTTAA